jgi:hypothetical protein
MFNPRSTRGLAAAATIVALSACSGVSQFSPGTQQGAFSQSIAQQNRASIPSVAALSADAKKAPSLIFAADEGSQKVAGGVYAYEDTGSNQSPIWELTGSPLKYPSGLWVDGSGNLYVADAGGAVYEYNKPTSSGPPGAPNFTYSDAGYQPNHIAVCGNYLYAANTIGPSSSSIYMTVWKIGTSKPSKIVAINGPQGPGYGVTCNDTTGNVYFGIDVSYDGPGQTNEYAAGGTGSPTSLCMTPQYLQGLTFNKKDTTMVLGDPYYQTGSGQNEPRIEFWKPTGCSPLHAITASWIVNPTGFAYESTDKYLWEADAGNNSLHQILPSKGTLENTITKTTAGVFASLQDVAISPADHK